MPPADLEAERSRAEQAAQRRVSDRELASHLMYPGVFADFAKHRRAHGRVDRLPTPVFFYGMQPGQEIAVDIDPGKTLVIRFLTVGEAGDDGQREVFFELNGQPRWVKVADRALAPSVPVNEKAEKDNPDQVPAPMPGVVTAIAVAEGGTVKSGDVLMTLEAMKMETAIRAPRDGRIARLVVKPGRQVEAKDLLVVLE
jgi:pyruvate carboxylase